MLRIFCCSLLLCALLNVVVGDSTNQTGEDCLVATSDTCPNVKVPLNHLRRKRYLSFPTGSSVGLVVQLVKNLIITFPTGWNALAEFEVAYKLPDAMFVAERLKMKHKLKHREKRDIWNMLEILLVNSNLNGKACLRRAACESKRYLAPSGVFLSHDLFRAIFSVPMDESTTFREEMDPEYHPLLEEDHCETTSFDKLCPISLLNIVMGSYKID